MTGIPQPPGSMLRPPSKIGGLESSGVISGKRKATTENDSDAGVLTAPNKGTSVPAAGRQIAAPGFKPKKAEMDTVYAGRRSSQGFKVTVKPQESAASSGARPGTTTGTSARVGVVRRAVPRQPAKSMAPRRIPANRSAVTRGRGGGVRKAPAPLGRKKTTPPPDSIKRRRIERPADAHAMTSPTGDNANNGNMGAGALPRPVGSNVDTKRKAGDDSSDEYSEDDSLGPPPAPTQRNGKDLEGRMRDLEAQVRYMNTGKRTAQKAKKQLSIELEHNNTKVTQLEYEKKLLEATVEDNGKQVRLLRDEVEDSQRTLQSEKRRHEDELDEFQRSHRREMEQVQEEQRQLRKRNIELEEDLDSTRATLQLKKDECAQLEATVSKQASEHIELEGNCRSLRSKAEQLENIISEREIRIAELDEDVASRSHTIEELEAKLRKEETLRRGLHNAIQELKGNIRVFCRVRPLGQADEAAMLPIRLPTCEDNNEIELTQTSENALGRSTSKTFPFKFDRVFESESTQEAVFEEVSQLIQSALDGYPVCIFAYGQTGSGKTHTMQGPDALSANDMDSSVLGVIPRAVKQIYENTSKLAERGWEYSLEGQFLEIYNETIQDLLAPATRNSQNGEKQTKLDIYQDSEGHTRVKNVTTVNVDSAGRVHWLLARAAENRTVAATNCNERSSRSHSVFTLYLRGKNSLTGESSSGVLNLIDLAGSERLSSSGSSGDRLKETQAINKSLACLGDVIAALAKGNRHIPYRNSKLTHLLQESLGAGNSKTLMFVCVNPSPSSSQESLCSLQFATKVNSCQIGTARRQGAT
ncbi:kinesin-domain-containing protein [Coemansia reversa NRRL 1564]|uniref:Kinesin-like protein n=1 Tax=Coemansia reversa (strain ATCC 12441 / NRRL 1564) TaxID=763665 RepID=A0A2G5BER9_COERN|nr:kinesin-domain-containing protein [Coemansia reversa NRRL 1564]|eukprot:PIA17526.1 kinesin-domain-containing protein [Coemansia reversa NRRL 1564]